MPILISGIRRLFDALGVKPSQAGAVLYEGSLTSGKNLSVYIGATPPLGVVSLEAEQHHIPGRESVLLRVDDKYKAPCFLEICISTSQEITVAEMELLKSEDAGTREKYLNLADTNLEITEQLLDVIGGLLGLRVHRQLVLKPLIQSAFLQGDFESVSSFVGPSCEMLEGLSQNADTESHLKKMLGGLNGSSEKALCDGGAIFHWLLRAWREADSIAKFMYLFIPLEAVLQSTVELAIESKADLDCIENIVQESAVPNKQVLLDFLNRARTRFAPTLNARFEEFARRAAIPGWELDVKAFKKYNRMRNLLLHAGNKNVRQHINFDEHTRTLEDLVERYVALSMFGTADVYASKWRPNRAAQT